MKTKTLKDFDEKYVGNKIGKIYSWKAEAYTDCSGVRDFIKYIIAQTREETIREVLELVRDLDIFGYPAITKEEHKEMLNDILNKLKK